MSPTPPTPDMPPVPKVPVNVTALPRWQPLQPSAFGPQAAARCGEVITVEELPEASTT
jgi:hypothetical protein